VPSRAISRRAFITGAAVIAGMSPACARAPRTGNGLGTAGEGLRVGIVGAGGRGKNNLDDLRAAGVEVVALCDCDRRQAAEAFGEYRDAQRYTDWRVMLEKQKDLDAVVVSTPDHNHAVVAVAAMRRGKHVYCEKPLARSVWEARQMARVAAETGVATQMGTQGHAFEGTRRAVEVIRSGAIGDVTELHVWTDRPAGWWPQGVGRPVGRSQVPDSLDWDVWLGPAPSRPYSPAYVPFKWRGFWDFGTGAIGDMGVHNLDTAFWALELTAPSTVRVKDCNPVLHAPTMNETAPLWSILELEFPRRGDKPAVKMTWYDGGKLPPRDLFEGEPLISRDGGSLIIGNKGTLFTRTWHGGQDPSNMFVLLPRRRFASYEPPAATLPRGASQHEEWAMACRGKGQTFSPFGYAAVLTEALLLGNVALRTGRTIEWDAARMRARNDPDADGFVRPEFRSGWAIE
jgi:predicted dehydrogenase